MFTHLSHVPPLQINNQMGGTGTAYFDTSALRCLLDPSLRPPAASSSTPAADWAVAADKAALLTAVGAELAVCLSQAQGTGVTLCRPDVFSDWSQYLDQFFEVGGVLQAVPTLLVSA
jgi:hypothetical protein